MGSRIIKINEISVIFGNTSFNGTYNMSHPEIELLSEHEQSLRSAMQPFILRQKP
jgi:ATP-dependent DNA helicase RecG